MAKTDKKNTNLLIGIAVIGGIILIAIGLAVWVLAGSGEQTSTTGKGFETNTPTAAVAQEVGSVSIDPQQITLARGPDGKLGAIATISALFQDFKPTSISFQGDPNLQLKSDCPQNGQALKAGSRCQVTITYNEQTAANGTPTTVTPTLRVVGESRTPGGSVITVEAEAQVGGGMAGDPNAQPPIDPNAIAANGGVPIAGQPGVAPGGPVAGGVGANGVAPNGVAPYGPVNPTTPPVDYSQPAVPAAQPTLSPREQFILARRQAVLGNVVRRYAQNGQPVSTGSWDEIGVPKSTSSAQQDMSRVVTMDRVITAVLVRPFDSRASQQVVAQVDRNVYGATGRTVLIPRGSTVIGTATGGSERVVINWTQIIRPDGARFVMKATAGDAMGQADVPGKVNRRIMRRIGDVLLGTVVKVGSALATNASEQPSGGFGGQPGKSNGAIINEILTADVNNILQNILRENVQPIITVPGGTRLTIIPQQDLVMRPVDRQTIVRPAYPRQMNGGAPAPTFEVQQGEDEQGQGNPYPQQQRQPTPFQPQPQARQQNAPNVVEQGLSARGPATNLGSTPPWGSN